MRHDSMGEINQHLVLEYVRDHPGAARVEIGEALGLSPASVSRIIAALLKSGRLVEDESRNVVEGPGRPRVGLRVNLGLEAVVGIDLGGTKCHGAVADIAGEILDEHVVLVADVGSAIAALTQVWEKSKAQAEARGLTVAAVAVGVPAVVDQTSGLASRGPNVGWEGIDIGSIVREFGVPYVIDNDVNLAAIAEGASGNAVGVKDYVVLSVGTGLGGAVVANGRLARGGYFAAGELGVMLASTDQVREERVGGVGGLETILSGRALQNRVTAEIAANPEAAAELGEGATPKELIASALAGGAVARRLVDEAIVAMSLAIVNVCAVLDPEVVVIDGSVGRALAPFFGEVERLVARHIVTPPRIIESELGPNSTVRGAIAGAVQLYRSQGAPAVMESIHDSEGALS